jgi:hypothetical protein
MACEVLEGIELGCERNSGGIHQILVGDMNDILTQITSSVTWSVKGMTVNVPPIEIEVKRKVSNYVEDEQEDFVNGSTVVTATITAMLHRRDAEKSRKLNLLSAGQRYLYVICKDANGIYWYFPNVQLQSVGEGSGQERADGSKYSVVFVGEDDHLAYEIESAVVADILATEG